MNKYLYLKSIHKILAKSKHKKMLPTMLETILTKTKQSFTLGDISD